MRTHNVTHLSATVPVRMMGNLCSATSLGEEGGSSGRGGGEREGGREREIYITIPMNHIHIHA
jgi:hypothetical protein